MKRKLNKFALFRDLGYTPHRGQIPVHRSQARRRVLVCGVRWGKTWCAAMEGLAAAVAPATDSKGWVVGPTYDLANRVFRQIVLVATSRIPHLIVELKESERLLVLRNLAGGLSEIRAKSADSPVSLLGEGLDWLIIDEAAQLRSEIWTARLSQRLLERRGWALIITTPTGRGWVYDEFRKGQGRDPDYESWNAPSAQNPIIDPALIEAERARLPERIFRQEYLGEFLEGAGAVFHGVRDCATGTFLDPIPGQVYFAGLDLARVEDYTVLTIMNRKHQVVFVDRFHRLDWDIQVNRIRATADRYNRAHILVDSTGCGEPVFEALRRAGCRVEPYPFTAKSKSDLITNLSLMIEQRKIVLPRPEIWPEGIDELEAFQFTVTDTGGVKMEAPYGYHDDCAVSLALAAWELRESRSAPQFRSFRSVEALQRALLRTF